MTSNVVTKRVPCPNCNGTGAIPDDGPGASWPPPDPNAVVPCGYCRGSGEVKQTQYVGPMSTTTVAGVYAVIVVVLLGIGYWLFG